MKSMKQPRYIVGYVPNDNQLVYGYRYLIRWARCGRPVWGRTLRAAVKFKTRMAAEHQASRIRTLPMYKSVFIEVA